MLKKIPLAKPSFSKDEFEEIQKVIDSGWVAGNGPTGQRLSLEMNDKYGFEYSLPIANCTAGLHLSLICLGIKEGDEVLVSDYTFPATGHSVLYTGAKPVFVDSLADTYNFDIDDARKKLTPRTKAIICVHTFGNMCNMQKLSEFAKENNLFLIEDAACALGSKWGDKYAGNWGDVGCFSMHARKNITCGEGGLMTFKAEDTFHKAKQLSAFGQQRAFERKNEKDFVIPVFKDLGFNYKLSDIACGILLAQLRSYDRQLKKRKQLALYYKALIKECDILEPQKIIHDKHTVYQAFVCLVRRPNTRNNLIQFLKESNIESQIGTYSSSEQPVYQVDQKCPVSKSLFENCIALPLHSDLTKDDLKSIIGKIKEFEKNV